MISRRSNPASDIPEPPYLRFLRRLVAALALTMIAGMVTLLTLLATRLPSPAPALPAEIVLPPGTRPVAITHGSNWYAVVTEDDAILVFDRETGDLRQEIQISSGD